MHYNGFIANKTSSDIPALGSIQGVSKKYCLIKMLIKENLLAIDCKHVLRAVSVLTFGSFTLYNLNNYDTNYIVFLYDHICQKYFL